MGGVACQWYRRSRLRDSCYILIAVKGNLPDFYLTVGVGHARPLPHWGIAMKRRAFIRVLTAAPAAPLLVAQQAPTPPPAAPPTDAARSARGAAGAQVQQFAVASADTVAAPAPSFFTAPQFATLRRLGNLLVAPRDGYPGAVEAKAPEFLDFLISVSPADSQQLYRNGLDALNAQANKQLKKSFADLDDTQADAVVRPLLVRIAWEKDMPSDPLKHFVAQAHRDLQLATRNTREYATATSTSGRRAGGRGFGGGAGYYVLPIDPIYKG